MTVFDRQNAGMDDPADLPELTEPRAGKGF